MGPSYNDSFGSFSSGGGGLSSGDSGGIFSGKSDKRSNVEQNSFDNQDIVLTPTPVNERKSSKKWAIVLLAVLAVAAIGLGIWWLISRGNLGGSSLSLPASFNKYANYLLYGKDSTEKIGRYDGANFLYYFDGKNIDFVSDDSELAELKDYYKKLTDDLSVFEEKASKSNLEASVESDVEEYVENAEDYFTLRQTFFPDELSIRMYYLDNAYDGTVEMIKQQYGGFVDSDHFVLSNMGDYLEELSLYYLNEYVAYKDNGCTNELDVDYNCQREVSFEYDKSKNELEKAVQVVMENLRIEVLKGCWIIYDKITK